jgi:DNA-binding IclR family transcriptional regulator
VMLAFGAGAAPDGRLERFTDRTLPDAKMLRREIADVQQQGWAQAVKEREDDLNAIAAPVYGANGRLAAILGVQGPAQRFGRKKREAALPLLLERADALSAALGYNPRVQ